MTHRELLNCALEARENAYAPYSGYRVGAALLCKNGKVYTGVNLENGSYSATLCAERAAFGAALSAGEREFSAIAIVGGKKETVDACTPPCGVCRKVMSEFCSADFAIVLGDTVTTLGQLLPMAFQLEDHV